MRRNHRRGRSPLRNISSNFNNNNKITIIYYRAKLIAVWGCEQSLICCFIFIFIEKVFICYSQRRSSSDDGHCLCYTKEALIKFHDESLPQPPIPSEIRKNVIWLICFGSCTRRKKSPLSREIRTNKSRKTFQFSHTRKKSGKNLWHAFGRKFHTKRWYDIWWPLLLPSHSIAFLSITSRVFLLRFSLFFSKKNILGWFLRKLSQLERLSIKCLRNFHRKSVEFEKEFQRKRKKRLSKAVRNERENSDFHGKI